MLGELHLIKDCFQNEFDVFISMNIRIFGRIKIFPRTFSVNPLLTGGNTRISIVMLEIIFDHFSIMVILVIFFEWNEKMIWSTFEIFQNGDLDIFSI